MGVRSTERDVEIERAMRAHPAGRALRDGRCPGAAVVTAPVAGASGGVRRAGAGPAPLRLTARGRRLVVGLALAAGAGVVALMGSSSGDGAGPSLHLENQSSVVVAPGDTLWGVAAGVAGEDDVRDVVRRIQQLNGLTSTRLVPGEVLRLP